ncbi:MAG: FAD-binding protein, partial [Dehalococcoidia bacterium]
AHSVPRILHAGGDATGQHIELSLGDMARRAGFTIREHSLLADVDIADGALHGVTVFDCRLGDLERLECRYLVLATGGAGQLFQLTTNSEVVTGDGVALAFRAGAEVMDMEFFQFHPTALRLPGTPPFLISEAVRGEGGILRNEDGRAFMADYAPEGEMAARDVVARAIVAEMRKSGADHAYVDVRHIPARTVRGRFPQIYQFCLRHGLDITRSKIPVAPAAHYMMGGVKINQWGETNIKGLLACGETACTGAHGANRLASNSLLETMVFAKRLVDRTRSDSIEASAAASQTGGRVEEVHHLDESGGASKRYPGTGLAALQRLMWENVGIVRTAEGLAHAAKTLAAWQGSLTRRVEPDRPSYDLGNAVLAGRLMAEAATLREESRGAHYRSDFPEPSPAWLKHLVFVRH